MFLSGSANWWRKDPLIYYLKPNQRNEEKDMMINEFPKLSVTTEAAMAKKSVALDSISSKCDFWASWKHSPPPPLNNIAFLFVRLYRPQHLHNIELGARVSEN